jgi:hypothetical protein
LLAQRDHPLSHRRRPAGELLQTCIARSEEARLPLREGAPSDVGDRTGVRDVAGRLPGFEQEPALGRRGEREIGPCHRLLLAVNASTVPSRLACHTSSSCATCPCPQQLLSGQTAASHGPLAVRHGSKAPPSRVSAEH